MELTWEWDGDGAGNGGGGVGCGEGRVISGEAQLANAFGRVVSSKRRPTKLDSSLSRVMGDVDVVQDSRKEDKGLCSLPPSRRAQTRDAAVLAG